MAKRYRLAALAMVAGLFSAGVPGAVFAAEPAALAGRTEQLAAVKDKAVEQVLLSSRGNDPYLRANAIEAIQAMPGRAMPMTQLALNDASPAVRFAALITIGKLKFQSLGPAAQKLLSDPSPSVRAAAIYATKRLGMDVNASPLADMLIAREPGVRANAAMVLGLLGDESAVPMMNVLSGTPLSRQTTPAQQAVYRVQVAEALVMLGDDSALEPIRAGAYSTIDDVRIVAIQAMGRLKDRRMESGLRALANQGAIQIRLAAAQALLEIGVARTDVRPVLLKAAGFTGLDVLSDAREMKRQLKEGDDDAYVQRLLDDGQAREAMAAGIRGQSAFGLGLLDDPQAAAALVKLLSDPVEQVRVSAAAAILRATEGAKGLAAR